MPDAPPPSLPWYAQPPGTAGPTPKGIYHDPATSFKMGKTLLKAAGPMLHKRGAKGRGKSKPPARSAKPTLSKK